MKKAIICVSLLLALILCFSVAFTASASEVPMILGDADRDGAVKIKDATLIQKYAADIEDLDEEAFICADADVSGKVNVRDATAIQKYIALLEVETPIGEPITSSEAPTTAPEEVKDITVYFRNNLKWQEVYINYWFTGEQEHTWHSVEMTYVETTAYGDDIYSAVIPSNVYGIMFCMESYDISTMDITDGIVDNAGFYCGDLFFGRYIPETFTYEKSEVVTTTTAIKETTTEQTAPTKPKEKMDTNITIYFSNNVSWTKVNAYLYNESTGEQNAQWPGKEMTYLTTNDYGEKIYKMDVDVAKFNRVVFNNGTSQSMNASLSVASSGFYISKSTPKSAMELGVYAYNEVAYGNLTTVNLKYPSGYNKPIYIWTPNGYDPADTTKEYKVIYLLDGQNQFLDSAPYNGGWGSDEIITALQHNGGEGIILVGIDNQRNRDNELTPDIGDVVPQYNSGGFKNGTGETFGNFVANDVMDYVNANYNTSRKPEDNAIVGSSSGGIEAFYIGMEHMDKFGNIGALSPAFLLYDKTEWDKYLAKFDFTETEKLPRIYFYNGGGDSLEVELNVYAKEMPLWLSKLGYPQDKMIFAYEEKNAHNECAWRCVMPEVVSWLFEL